MAQNEDEPISGVFKVVIIAGGIWAIAYVVWHYIATR